MKWVASLFIVIGGVAGGLYWGLPWILQEVIVQQAAIRGVVVEELAVQRPSWGLAVVDRIALTVGGNVVEAEKIVIGFTWDSLSVAQATDVTVGRLRVAASASDSAPEQQVEVGELIGALPAILASAWELVPAQTFTADEVLVGLTGMDFAGAMEFSRAHASLRGRVDGPPPLPPLQLVSRLEPGGKVHARAQELGSVANVVEVHADLGTASGSVTGSWQLPVETGDGPITVSVQGSAPFALTQAGWSLDSGVALALNAAQWSATLELASAAGSWNPSPQELLRLRGDWAGSAQLSDVGVKGHGSVSAIVGDTAAQLLLDSGSVVSVAEVSGADWSIASTTTRFTDLARLQVTLQPLGIRLQSSTGLAVQLDQARWAGFELSPFMDVTVDELSTDLATLESAVQLELESLQMSAAAKITGNLSDGSFAATFSTEQSFAQPVLAGLFPAMLEVVDADVDAGRVATSGAVRVGAVEGEVSGTLSVTLADLSAHYEDIVITGIEGNLGIVFDDSAWRIGPGQVVVALADVGFPITDIRAGVDLSAESLRISELTGRALGGDVAVTAMTYDIGAGTSDFIVDAAAVHLAEVLALEGDTITGSGTLDGQLPLQIAGSQVRVDGGRFSANEPGGVLSYGGAEDAAASLDQPGVGFAIAALGDFRYSVLDVDVSYEPNGDLLLGIHLEGNNPRFEAGRAIHYNLNISENIPVLLKSLQLSDEVGKQLEKRLVQ